MKYYLCNWLGVVNGIPRDKDYVLEDISSPYSLVKSDRLGYFYVPESHTRFDGIRRVLSYEFGRQIKTVEDLEYYETEYRARSCESTMRGEKHVESLRRSKASYQFSRFQL